MDELQDELDKYDGKVVDGRLSYNPEAFVDAARLVANPNIEAACKECAAWFGEYRKGSEITAAAHGIVAAALTPGDTNDPLD